MDPNTLKALQGAAGAAGGGTKYVEEVFSTDLWVGTGSSKDIENDIDLDGEGGMVWIKMRTAGYGHRLIDTERTAEQVIESYDTTVEATQTGSLTDFNSNGFTVGNAEHTNRLDEDMVAWSFRKAPGFFDVVKFEGNASPGMSPRAIAHDLGCKPGCIFFKNLDSGLDWVVYHKNLTDPSDVALALNEDWDEANALFFGDTDPTSTHFYVGDHDGTNKNDDTIIAYLFADGDDADAKIFGDDEDEAIIKCGTFGGTGTLTNVGFEPQWILVKRFVGSGDWHIYDNMRGMALPEADSGGGTYVVPNGPAAETDGYAISFESNGFYNNTWGAANSMIYVAIRRGPMKTPEDATKVFAMDTFDGTPLPTYYSGFPVDFYIRRETNADGVFPFNTRILGDTKLNLPERWAEAADTGAGFDRNDGVREQTGTLTAWQAWMFQRAPSFFDVVAYEGTGSAKTVSHNLGVAPEFIISTIRSDSGYDWICWHSGLSTNNNYIALNNTSAENSNSDPWNNTAPTATQFSLSDWENNANNESYIAYLFASCPGVSKVGTVTIGSSAIEVTCEGFTNGARFVMIKRTDAAGAWHFYDTLRGIATGNDPYLAFNSKDAEVTNTDYIDPLPAGFKINPSLPAGLTAGDYIYLAIA